MEEDDDEEAEDGGRGGRAEGVGRGEEKAKRTWVAWGGALRFVGRGLRRVPN